MLCSIFQVHESRLLQDNIKIAFERLKYAVDNHLNGSKSYEAEFQRFERRYEQRTKRTREKRRQIKEMANDEPIE